MTQQGINNTSMLKVGTILHGTYRIDSYLSSGGFRNRVFNLIFRNFC